MQAQIVIDGVLLPDATVENIDDRGHVKIIQASTEYEKLDFTLENCIVEFNQGITPDPFVMLIGYCHIIVRRRKDSEQTSPLNDHIRMVKIKLYLK